MNRLGVLALLAICLASCRSTQDGPPIAHPTSPTARPLLAQLEAAPDLAGRRVGTSDRQATLVISFASWCSHCKAELVVIDALRARHPELRILGVSYKAHEEFAGRGGSSQLRAFLASAPWLRVIPADAALFTALGRPPLVPMMWIFDRDGALVETYDRRERPPPDAAELDALLLHLGG